MPLLPLFAESAAGYGGVWTTAEGGAQTVALGADMMKLCSGGDAKRTFYSAFPRDELGDTAAASWVAPLPAKGHTAHSATASSSCQRFSSFLFQASAPADPSFRGGTLQQRGSKGSSLGTFHTAAVNGGPPTDSLFPRDLLAQQQKQKLLHTDFLVAAAAPAAPPPRVVGSAIYGSKYRVPSEINK